MEDTPKKEREESRWVTGPNGWKHVRGDPGQDVLFDPDPEDMPWPDEDPNFVPLNSSHDEGIQEGIKAILSDAERIRINSGGGFPKRSPGSLLVKRALTNRLKNGVARMTPTRISMNLWMRI